MFGSAVQSAEEHEQTGEEDSVHASQDFMHALGRGGQAASDERHGRNEEGDRGRRPSDRSASGTPHTTGLESIEGKEGVGATASSLGGGSLGRLSRRVMPWSLAPSGNASTKGADGERSGRGWSDSRSFGVRGFDDVSARLQPLTIAARTGLTDTATSGQGPGSSSCGPQQAAPMPSRPVAAAGHSPLPYSTQRCSSLADEATSSSLRDQAGDRKGGARTLDAPRRSSLPASLDDSAWRTSVWVPRSVAPPFPPPRTPNLSIHRTTSHPLSNSYLHTYM